MARSGGCSVVRSVLLGWRRSGVGLGGVKGVRCSGSRQQQLWLMMEGSGLSFGTDWLMKSEVDPRQTLYTSVARARGARGALPPHVTLHVFAGAESPVIN